MIGDYFLRLINWLLQGLMSAWPSDFPYLTFSTYQGHLTTFKTFIIPTFNWINNVFPIDFFLLLITLTLIIEFAVFRIKQIQYGINITRGAGG